MNFFAILVTLVTKFGQKLNKVGYIAITSRRWVGRGGNASLPTFELDHDDGRTNRRTDKASHRVASPRLKIGEQTKLLLKS